MPTSRKSWKIHHMTSIYSSIKQSTFMPCGKAKVNSNKFSWYAMGVGLNSQQPFTQSRTHRSAGNNIYYVPRSLLAIHLFYWQHSKCRSVIHKSCLNRLNRRFWHLVVDVEIWMVLVLLAADRTAMSMSFRVHFVVMPKVNSLVSKFKRRQWAYGQKCHHPTLASSWHQRKHSFIHRCFERTPVFVCVCVRLCSVAVKISPINIPLHMLLCVYVPRSIQSPDARCHVVCSM